jgi:enoyl-CoA hydratase/carnithine racemase
MPINNEERSMTTDVHVTDRDRIRWIEIDRPETRNGLTADVNRQLIAALSEINEREDLRVAVLAGAGGSFCSGLDLKSSMRSGGITPKQIEDDLRGAFHGLIRAIRAVDAPVLAAVDGAAVGFGCDLALACDIRIVSESACFAELFVKRGLMPDGGSTFSLPRLVGVGRALELMFTGDRVGAEEAHRIGLANHVVSVAEMSEFTWDLARRLASGPPLAYRAIKRSVYASLSDSFEGALQRELENQLQLLGTADFIEGFMAFLQKRAPTLPRQVIAAATGSRSAGIRVGEWISRSISRLDLPSDPAGKVTSRTGGEHPRRM